MSAFREVTIECDAECSRVMMSIHPTIISARFEARMYLWHFVSGRDICPYCWTAGKR